ncbi:hypothetical protein OROGR_001881 [Orobanche gracilis]
MANSTSSEARDLSKDPTRKAKSSDPGWKYGFWPDLNNKDIVQCSLCNKQVHADIRRLKQHLAGGYGDVQMCAKTTTSIIKEMQDYIRKNTRKTVVPLDGDNDDDVEEVEPNDISTAASNTVPSSGTSSKRKKASYFMAPQSKPTKSIASILRKTPEEVVEERHCRGPYQTTIENSTKTAEEKERVNMHIANFFYENGIPFNAAHSRSYEIMIESIGQFGPGLKPPTYHDLRVPLLEKAKKETDKLRERHEKAWKQYGCTLMPGGFSDRKGRHLINLIPSLLCIYHCDSVNEISVSLFCHPKSVDPLLPDVFLFRHCFHNLNVLAIRKRDSDRDGKVDFKEFFHGLFDLVRNYDEVDHNSSHEFDESVEAPAKVLFRQLDKDGDGYLSDVELLPIIGKIHPSEGYYAKQQMEYIMQQADTDKDGRLTLTEMIENPYVFYSAVFDENEDDDYVYHDEFR